MQQYTTNNLKVFVSIILYDIIAMSYFLNAMYTKQASLLLYLHNCQTQNSCIIVAELPNHNPPIVCGLGGAFPNHNNLYVLINVMLHACDVIHKRADSDWLWEIKSFLTWLSPGSSGGKYTVTRVHIIAVMWAYSLGIDGAYPLHNVCMKN